MHETVRGLSTKLDWLVQQQEKMAAPLAQGDLQFLIQYYF